MTTRGSQMFSAVRWGLGLVLGVAIAGAASAAVAPLDSRSAAQLSAALQAPVKVSYSRATGAVSFLTVAPGSAASLAPAAAGSADDRARAFFAAQSTLFGIRDVRAELFLKGTKTEASGQQHLTYEQFHRGVPVFAGQLRAHFDASGRLQTVNGSFVPGLDVQVRPATNALFASQRAIDFVRERNGRVDADGLSASTPTLLIYRLGLDKGVAGPSQLAWRVDVSNGGEIREFVFVEAQYGKVIDFLPGIHDAANRRAFIGTDGAAPPNSPQAWPLSPDWVEGNAIPSGNQERDNMLLSSKDVYDRFAVGFGYNSYDDAEHVMDQAYNRDYACPNASWNGNLISFCPGFTTHDVTAHEWGHAYTEYTHGLIYRWQSGALSEAYSDIWGEAFDLNTNLAGMIDTDAPATLRTANSCTSSQVGLPRQLLVNSPATIDGVYASGQPQFGPNIVGNAPTQDVVLVVDDGTVTPDINDACETTPLVNAAALVGKIAFVNRGTCNVSVKTENVQAAGAVGMILGNVATSANPTVPASPGCGSVPDCSLITIPTVTLNLADADLLRTELAAPINATFQPTPSQPVDNSVRWLMGEDVAGGALRDMWNPTCYANPGKVTDPQYHCADTDNGGVHFNSGVPNHAFALLSDGGVYNGHTVTAIGMVKALHLYFRTQTVYQSAASDFGDHADAMETSCNDLVTAATSLTDPWGGAPQTMVAGDCVEVADAMLAVEMRTEPTACNFTPLLTQNPPAICATGFAYPTHVYDWEGGAAGWTVTRRGVVNPGTFLDRDWTIDASLPGGRVGSAYFALDPTDGDCGPDDESGALVLESPTLSMPFGGAVPRVTFDHYVTTEAQYDGGNLKVSVNGGPYTVVPPAAFSFNDQIGAMAAAPGNTSPLAGEQGWHGSDAGSNSGTWGRTIGSLTGIVAPGQNFKLRYEFGSDGCGGTDLGWWVDDVQIYTCQAFDPLFIDGFEGSTSSRWSFTAP